VGGVLSVVFAAAVLGWLLTRWQVLPGTTAVWGSSPGAASAMMLMAEAYGADLRLVAFMQYLRVVCVALVVSLVSRFWTSGAGGEAPAIDWFPPIAWLPFVETLAVVGIGTWLGIRLRVPAGSMLVPLAAGIALQMSGLLTLELPQWLLAISYAVVGWSVGARFTRAILLHALRAFPAVLGSTLTLIAICGCFAVVLVKVAGVDPLTAYLATSPGGADSVAIIAASSNVDVSFVMTMQMARLLFVLLTGPSLARFISNHTGLSKRVQEPVPGK
jgi:membrane AbrB-like protein